MDNPNITMEEYIRLQEEKALSHDETFNWQTATYRKKEYYDDEDESFTNFEAKFPAIILGNIKLSHPKPHKKQPWGNTKLIEHKDHDWISFEMEVPDAMISDAIKKKAGYEYYRDKKVESEKAKIVYEPEEQHVSPVKSGRGKGFMCYGDQVANVPNKLKKDVVPRKTRSLTIAEEAVVGSKASRLESLRQKKQIVTRKGSSAAQNKYYSSSDTDSDATLYSSSSDTQKEVQMKLMMLTNQIWTYPTIIHMEMMMQDFIQNLLDEIPANELMDFMSHPVYTDAQTTSVVHNPEGNPELTSYISGASEILLGTYVDVLVTKTLMQEMFPGKNTHCIPSLLAKKIPYPTTYPQPSSLQAKAKKLIQNAKKNMRKFNFKKALAQKFKEYDQKLEALTNFNVSEAFEKASNDTHTTQQQLYDTLYQSIILDQDVLDAQDVKPSFHKRSHDNQDPPNNHEVENKKKGRKDADEPSSRSSRRNKSPVVIVQDDTPQYYQKLSKTVMKEMYLNPYHLNDTCQKVQNHILASTTTTTLTLWISAQKRSTLLLSSSIMLRDTTKKVLRTGSLKDGSKKFVTITLKLLMVHTIGKRLIDFFKAEMSDVTEGHVFSDLRIKSVVRIDVEKKRGYGFLTSIVVRISDDKNYKFSYADLPRLSVNDVEDMYLLQVQDKLYHLPL
nr:hypothetical protein [Tanacetum cinerariifolium]